MNGRYEIRGSNTFYKVWGILTFVFVGIYGLIELLGLIILGAAAVKENELSNWLGIYSDAYFSDAGTYLVLIFVFTALSFTAGVVIRILSGIQLARNYVKSTGAMIAAAVFNFLMGMFHILALIGNIKLSFGFGIFCSLLFMGWSIATGICLLLKQAAAVRGGSRASGLQEFYRGAPDEGMGMAENGYQSSGREIPGQDLTLPLTWAAAEEPAFGPGNADAGHAPQVRVEGLFGEYKGKTYILRSGESCRIGRDSDCDIQIHHAKVSRIHCAVQLLSDGRLELTDYSYNGTYYENKALTKGVPAAVKPGGLLAVGDADNVFSLKII